MPGLFDIAPPEVATETLVIRGTELELRGVSVRELAILGQRYPWIIEASQASADGKPAAEVALANRAKLLDSIPAFIAAALGHCGEAKYETGVTDRLSDSEQLQVFSIVSNLTYNASIPVRPSPPAGENAAASGKDQVTS